MVFLNRLLLQVLVLLALWAISPVNAQYGNVEYRYGISYWFEREGAMQPGSSVILVNNFANRGNVYLRITRIVVTLGSSEFFPSSGLPMVINISQTVRLNMTIRVPSSATYGFTGLAGEAAFQYLHPDINQWITPSDSPIVYGERVLVGSPSQLLAGVARTIAPFAIGTYIALLGMAAVLIVREKRKRANQPAG